VKKIAVLLLLVAGTLSLPAAGQTVKELKITDCSAFSAPSTIRNPFWPIGWSRPTAVAQTPGPVVPVVQEIRLKPEDFVISSISTGQLPLAVINGRAYAEGELISMNVGTPQPMIVQVYAIRDGAVTLRYRDKTVVAFLKGVQLPAR